MQHGSPLAPHASQKLLEPTGVQLVCVCVHWLPEQQGSPMPPQFSQMGEAHTLWTPVVDAHALPEATHAPFPVAVPVSQQPFALHWSPGQHAWPGFPHGTHALT